MARIRGRDTAPEMLLRRALWKKGVRYRVNYRASPGRADIAFPSKRVLVFVDGCFWHGCPDHYVMPRSRAGFWARKLRENVDRDRRQTLQLEAKGWKVLRFWEHEVFTGLEDVVGSVRAALSGTAMPGGDQWRVVAVEPLAGRRERRSLEKLRDVSAQWVVEADRSTKKW